jgi:hypothetical protein
LLTRLRSAGFPAIVVVGGATAVVGDPSGRTAERVALAPETVHDNALKLAEMLRRACMVVCVVGWGGTAAVAAEMAAMTHGRHHPCRFQRKPRRLWLTDRCVFGWVWAAMRARVAAVQPAHRRNVRTAGPSSFSSGGGGASSCGASRAGAQQPRLARAADGDGAAHRRGPAPEARRHARQGQRPLAAG